MPKKANSSFASWVAEWMGSRSSNTAATVHSLEQSREQVKKSIAQHLEVMASIDKSSSDYSKFDKYRGYYEQELVEVEKRLRAARKQLRAEQGEGIDSEALYNRIVSHPAVTSVLVNDKKELCIVTKPIIVDLFHTTGEAGWEDEDGDWHDGDSGDGEDYTGQDIGRFLIKLTQSKGDFYFYNMDWRVDNYDRPHIKEGRACQGDYSYLFKDLEAKANLFGLVDAMIYFLKTAYTPGDCMIEFDEWMNGREKISEEDFKRYSTSV